MFIQKFWFLKKNDARLYPEGNRGLDVMTVEGLKGVEGLEVLQVTKSVKGLVVNVVPKKYNWTLR